MSQPQIVIHVDTRNSNVSLEVVRYRLLFSNDHDSSHMTALLLVTETTQSERKHGRRSEHE